MITVSTNSHRQKLLDELNSARQARDSGQAGTWFLGTSASDSSAIQDIPFAATGAAVAKDATPEEEALMAKAKRKKHADATAKSHLRTIDPSGKPQDHSKTNGTRHPSTSSKKADPAILELANNNDLNVATLARQAHKAQNLDDLSDGEVVIPLH